MVQAIGLVVVIVLVKLLYDFIKEQFDKGHKSTKGDVIDISNAWIDTGKLPYRIKDSLFNPKEVFIYQMLQEILDDKFAICPRIRMADLLAVPFDSENRQEYINRIQERSLDLVIVDASQLKPVLAINMEIINEGNKKKQLSDRFVEKVLSATHLPLITLDLNNPPTTTQLASRLRDLGLAISSDHN